MRFYYPRRVVLFADSAIALNFHHEGTNDKNLWVVVGLTNIFVPYTKASDLPAHEIEAMPQIRRFASEPDELVEQILVREGDREPSERWDRN